MEPINENDEKGSDEKGSDVAAEDNKLAVLIKNNDTI